MATKVKNKKHVKKSENTKQIEYLQTLLKYTVRCIEIDSRYEGLHLLFSNQANRINQQISLLEEKQ